MYAKGMIFKCDCCGSEYFLADGHSQNHQEFADNSIISSGIADFDSGHIFDYMKSLGWCHFNLSTGEALICPTCHLQLENHYREMILESRCN